MYHSPDKLFEESRSIGKERKSQLLTDSTKSGMRFITNNPFLGKKGSMYRQILI